MRDRSELDLRNQAAVDAFFSTRVAGAGIESITWSATGAQATPETVIEGSSATLVIDTDGVTEVTFFATDKNEENFDKLEVLLAMM